MAQSNRQTQLSFRVRTEQSYSYSPESSSSLADSLTSLCIVDQPAKVLIDTLRKQQLEKSFKSRSCNGSSEINPNVYAKHTASMSLNSHSKSSDLVLPPTVLSVLLASKQCPQTVANSVHDRAYGALFGFVIGDCIGGHLIHRSSQADKVISAMLMCKNQTFNLNPGEGTDETQICLSTAEGLLASRGVYDSNIMAQKYYEWIASSPFDMPAIMAISFSKIRQHKAEQLCKYRTMGIMLIESSLRNAKHESTLGLIRMIPLVLWGLKLSSQQFDMLVQDQLKLITPNQLVLQICLIYANLLRSIILTGDPMLAYHQACQSVYASKHKNLLDVWSLIETNTILLMSNINASRARFPFIYSVNELLEYEAWRKDKRLFFIDCLLRVLNKGYNTDTNCSVVLGMVGAAMGYHEIPSYYKAKIIEGQVSQRNKNRTKIFQTSKIMDIVNQLLQQGPKQYNRRNNLGILPPVVQHIHEYIRNILSAHLANLDNQTTQLLALNHPIANHSFLPLPLLVKHNNPNFTLQLIHFKSIPSTMLLSADWPRENLLDRSAIAFLADNQSMGQGQQSNTWVSPPGNVYLTLLLQVNIDIISYLPMLCSNQCLAIIRKHAPTIKNRITCKWINDLFINDRKVGGMLIRCSNSGGNIYAEIGIGINIKTSPLADSTCLQTEIGKSISVRAFAQEIAITICNAIRSKTKQCIPQILSEYAANLNYINEIVAIYDNKLTNIQHIGTFIGLSSEGYAILSHNNIQTIISQGRMRLYHNRISYL